MEEDSAKTWFENQLRKTLNGLYDPVVLSSPPLPQLFNLAQTAQHSISIAAPAHQCY